jgi:hypothetical protein
MKTALLWTVMQCVVVESVRNYHNMLLYGPEDHSFWNLFLSSVPLIDSVDVLDRISGFSSIEECSFPGVLMNGTVSIFSHLG